MSSPAPGAFRPTQLRLLELVADLGALAIVQARQLDAQTRQQAHLAQLLEISRGLGRMPDTDTVVGLTISALRRLIHCEEAVLFRYEAVTQTLCGMAGVGTQSRQLAEAHIRVSDPQSVTAWVAQQRRPLLYASGTHGFIGPATETLLTRREMALLAVPLLAREQLWGVILLTRAAPFETAELRTMLTLSQIIAPSLVQGRESR
jgi:transcriptional regulator with GAF, ATPase, and Fis domain